MLDTLFINAELIDGSGAPPTYGRIGVRDGRIVLAEASAPARQTVDCQGLVLCPGFIDSHTHDDALVLETAPLGQHHPKLSQGVTTVVTGNCGVSLAPLRLSAGQSLPSPLDVLPKSAFRFQSFAEYLQALRDEPPAINVLQLVGHTTLRAKHMAALDREASASEQAAMARELEAALDAGAWGLSTGVFYPPARAATQAELEAVAAPLKARASMLTMHLRSEADEIEAALREAFAVGKSSGAKLVLSHHKLMGLPNHGKSAITLPLIEQAAAQQSVCMDCYPYDASSTMLLAERVATSATVRITESQADPLANGRWLHELAAERAVTAAEAAQQLMPARAIYFGMAESDVQRILAHPLTMIGSDGLAHDARPHPRLWGSFARVLGHYRRDVGLFSLETAIHKMTGLPAARFGLDQANQPRGLLREGFAADLVLLNPQTINERASYDEPTKPASGIEAVFINGQLASNVGGVQNAHLGQALAPPA